MRILAIICVRNESKYLSVLLPYLSNESVDVVLIDNDSNDETLDTFTPKNFPNIAEVIQLPFNGSFDLTAQLAVKQTVAEKTTADWIIHQDADEILQSASSWGGLRQSIEEADANGFNVLNFNEFVMLPCDPEIDDITTNNSRYYFFEPRPLRLMRAWKSAAKLTNSMSGGHVLTGEDVNVSPQRMILKHFIVRSQQHAFQKYLGRKFSAQDLSKGWHGNRLQFTKDNLMIPQRSEFLHELVNPKSTPAIWPRSVKKHFWEWPTSYS